MTLNLPRVVVVTRSTTYESVLARHATRGQAEFLLSTRGHDINAIEHEERQSSSGVIVSTGTGATGWARSINEARAGRLRLPRPSDRKLAFFVREAFPSVATATEVTGGLLEKGQALQVISENEQGGAIFGDGIEDDLLDFFWGRWATVRVADVRLAMVH